MKRFTGEFLVPGESGERIEADHRARYTYAQQFATGRAVLDIACGTGYGTRMMCEAGAAHATGVDIAAEPLAIAMKDYAGDGATFLRGDIAAFGDADSFDLITCFETIEHVPDADAALRNLRRVLRPDGLLLLSSPNRGIVSPHARRLEDPPQNTFHVREFMPRELAAALSRAGFTIDGPVLGQRQQPNLGRALNAAYGRVVHPEARATPSLRSLPAWKTCRYFVLCARQAPGRGPL